MNLMCSPARILIEANRFCIVWIVAICFPFFVNFCLAFGAEVALEDLKSGKMTVNIGIEKEFLKIAGISCICDYGVVFQENYFWKEGCTEKRCCFVELGEPVNIEGISIPYPGAKQSTYYSKTTSNECYFVGGKVQFWVAILVGGLSGIVISMVMLKVIFWHITERSAAQLRIDLGSRANMRPLY